MSYTAGVDPSAFAKRGRCRGRKQHHQLGAHAERERGQDQPAPLHVPRLRCDRPKAVIPRFFRLAAGVVLVWSVAQAAVAPEIPPLASSAAVLVFVLTLWRPGTGLVAAISLAPAGLLLAPPPIRAGELMAWSFLGAWLIAVWQPIPRLPRRFIYLV